MNVWSIQKAISIKLFLFELTDRFGQQTFCLDDTIQNDQAVMIFLPSQPDLSAYIYSFSQSTDHYGIDLFFPIDAHAIVGEHEELTLDAVLAVIETHFN